MLFFISPLFYGKIKENTKEKRMDDNMEKSQLSVTDFRIAWNSFAVNTVCPICGDRTEPSINFQVQTSSGEAICETCLLEEATDLAEVLYAFFAYKYPQDEMVKLYLSEIKQRQLVHYTKPKAVSLSILEEIQSATGAVALSQTVNREQTQSSNDDNARFFLVTKKWLLANDPAYAENIIKDNDYDNYFSSLHEKIPFSDRAKMNALYLKALDEGAVIAESDN